MQIQLRVVEELKKKRKQSRTYNVDKFKKKNRKKTKNCFFIEYWFSILSANLNKYNKIKHENKIKCIKYLSCEIIIQKANRSREALKTDLC